MRETGLRGAPMPAARAVVAGAALLAGAAWTHAKAEPPTRTPSVQETALAIPRVRAPRGGPVGLAQPLRPSEAARIRRIYALLARDRLTEAAAATRALGPSLLRGDLIAARILRAPHRVETDALAHWLRRWPDLPAAPAIRAILRARGIAQPLPTPPVAPADPPPPTQEPPAPPLPSHPLPNHPVIEREVASRIAAGAFDTALRLVAGTRGLDALSAAHLRAEVAQALFRAGRPRRALVLARSVLDGSDEARGRGRLRGRSRRLAARPARGGGGAVCACVAGPSPAVAAAQRHRLLGGAGSGR